jgi:ribose/xylose/arabinose/galactoside ABC-type transport system permease subunit
MNKINILKKINDRIANKNLIANDGCFTEEQLKEQRIDLLRSNVPFIAIISVVLLFTLVSGTRFFSSRNFSFIIQQTSILLLLSFAQLVVVTSGSIDISVGSNIGLSAFFGALGMMYFGPIGIVLAIIVATFVGFINGVIFSVLKIPSFVTTLATQIILRAILIIISGGSSIYLSDKALSSGMNVSSVEAKWLLELGTYPYIFFFVSIFTVVMVIFYDKTIFGAELKAIGGKEKVLNLAGISVTWAKIKVFTIAGLIVGFASILNLARAGAATPQAGNMLELDTVAAVALGGTPLTGGYGSVMKTVVGALILTIVANGLTIAGVSPSWNRIARGMLLIVAIAISLNRKKIDVVK